MATLRQLKTFVATAEHKKMSEAAKHLYVSQPTISQIISDLEKAYDTILFERHAKELRITPAGELLLENAKQIIAIHENLEQNMKTISSKRPLRIGATLTVGTNIMAKIVKGIEEEHPDIDCFVHVNNTEHIEEMLLHNELDIAIVEGIIDHEEIITAPAFDDNLCIICSKEHPLASKQVITPDDLHDQQFILREKGSGTRKIFEQLMRNHHIPYKVKWESNSTPAITDAVAYNLGLAFVPVRCVNGKASRDSICICPIQEINMKRYFFVAYHKYHPMTSAMQDFTNYINELPCDFQ